MVSATLQDIVRRYKASKFGSRKAVRHSFREFPNKVILRSWIILIKKRLDDLFYI